MKTVTLNIILRNGLNIKMARNNIEDNVSKGEAMVDYLGDIWNNEWVELLNENSLMAVRCSDISAYELSEKIESHIKRVFS